MAPAKVTDAETNIKNKKSSSSFSHAHAKQVVVRGVDYTLLMILLLLQYMRCAPPTVMQVSNNIQNGVYSNVTSAADVYTCDFGEDDVAEIYKSPGILSVGILFFVYGIVSPIFVFIHSNWKFKNIGEEYRTKVEKIFQCTDNFIFIDSIIEIPICFYNAPIFTVAFWGIYGGFLVGLYFAAVDFASKFDSNATSVFNGNCGLAAVSLLQLTGQLCQYAAIYNAAAKDYVRKQDENPDGKEEHWRDDGGDC